MIKFPYIQDLATTHVASDGEIHFVVVSDPKLAVEKLGSLCARHGYDPRKWVPIETSRIPISCYVDHYKQLFVDINGRCIQKAINFMTPKTWDAIKDQLPTIPFCPACNNTREYVGIMFRHPCPECRKEDYARYKER